MTGEASSSESPLAAMPTAPARVPARRRAGWYWLGATLLALALIASGAIGTAWWALRSESGSAWLLSLVPGLKVTQPKGSLIGDFSAGELTLTLAGTGQLRVFGLASRGLEIARAPAGLRLRIAIADLRAARVEWQSASAPADAAPSAPPTGLALPLELDIAALHIGEARLGAGASTPLRDVEARVHLGADGGAAHGIDDLALVWGRIRITGSGKIATAAPLQLEMRIDAAQDAAESMPAWSASANATGPLAAPTVQAVVRAPSAAGRPAQTLDARASVRPFASWPLGDLDLAAQGIDLSMFHDALPVTALSGTAVAQTRGPDQPSVVIAKLTNAAPGHWDAARLPLRTLDVELRARPDDLRALDLQTFSAELGGAERPAGRIEGRGRWTPERWNADVTLVNVAARGLDGRAPAITLSGPLAFGSIAVANAALAIDVKGTLTGQVAERGPARPVRIALDASLGAQRIDLRRAEARAGNASAELAGSATRMPTGDAWQLKGRGALVDFDPALWLPGADGSAWRNGPHRLNAQATFDLALPASVGALPLFELLAAVRGAAGVTLAESVLAGVPLKGEASWRNSDGQAALAKVRLEAAGNSAQLEGRVGLDRAGAADAWDAVVAAPALNRLAPLWRLAQSSTTPKRASAAPAPATAGALRATAHVTGRWPALTTRGELEAEGLRLGSASVEHAQGRWALGTAPRAPVEVDATLTRAALDGPSIESMHLRLSGTSDAHHVELRAESKALPPAWTDALQAASTPRPAAATGALPGSASAPAAPASPAAASGPARGAVEAAPRAAARSVAVLQAEGGLIGAPPNGIAGWRGRIGQVELRHSADGGAAWVRARDVALDAQWTGGPARVTLQPGRAEILGANLRWSRAAWQAADGPGQPMRLDLQAELDPLPVAPLLRQAQPDFGWGGDLTIGGHIDIHTTPAVGAEVVFERRAGDLSVTDETGTQALDLTDLRFALAAADGVWNFTAALAGKTLGVASAAVVARTPPNATWPTADTPIQGVVELRVANLGTWGNWVPAGWRLGGELRTSASLGGRLGAPEYTGEIVGRSLSVRNFLQGVNVSDGDVAIALKGTTARIERFSARAGGGSITLEGNASLGEAPQAQIAVSASKFQVLGRVDRRIVASGQAQLHLDAKTAALDGRFTLDEGLIDFSRGDAPTLGDDVQVIRRGTGTAASPGSPEAAAAAQKAKADSVVAGTAPATARNLALDLQVGMGEHLHVRGRGLDAYLRGELRITSPNNRLAVNGTVYTVDGTYAAYGQKLAIDRGQLTFAGTVENPRLDIEATRPNLDIRVGVAVTGSALNPRVRLFSEPDQSEMDKLSWLVLGRASEGLGRTDTALLQRAALALLAGEGSGGTDPFTKALGLDDLSVRQTEGEVRQTIVSLGKQLSRRWYVGYERGLNATTGSWQLIYRIAQRFTLRAQSGDDNSVDLIWTWRWQ